MIWLFANWKALAVGFGVIALFYSGWHSHTIYDGYVATKQARTALEAAHAGESNLIKFTSAYSKEVKNAKDDKCLDANIPVGIAGLLRAKPQ